MKFLFKFLNRKKNAGEIASLNFYRRERGELVRQYREEIDDAKSELDTAIVIPMAGYRQRRDAAYQEMRRAEECLWQEHLARVKSYAN